MLADEKVLEIQMEKEDKPSKRWMEDYMPSLLIMNAMLVMFLAWKVFDLNEQIKYATPVAVIDLSDATDEQRKNAADKAQELSEAGFLVLKNGAAFAYPNTVPVIGKP